MRYPFSIPQQKEMIRMSKLTLERAKEILPKHTTEQHLFVHAACVSAAMGAMAEAFGEDRDHWEASRKASTRRISAASSPTAGV